MRVAFVSGMTGSPWGGSEVLWSQSALALRQQGHRVLASVHGWPATPPQVSNLRLSGIEVEECQRHWLDPLVRRASKGSLGDGGSNSNAQSFQRSVARLRKFRPEIVCVSHGGARCGLNWMEWCHQEGIPYVSLSQANSEGAWPRDRIAERLLVAHSGATWSCFVSLGNLQLFEKQIGQALSNARIVWNPVQVQSAKPLPWPVCDSELRFACVGRLDPRAKGQDIILQVLAEPVWRDRRVFVSLFGSGPMKESLQRLARSLGVDGKVCFNGHVEPVERIWGDHHALLLPSRFEGLPLALVEAMHCGRAAVVTDVAGNAEVIDDNLTGFVAESPSPKHVAEAMERAWSRRGELRSIGLAAAQSIRERISSDPVGEFVRLLLNCGSKSIKTSAELTSAKPFDQISLRIDCVVRTKNSSRTLKACLEALRQSSHVDQIIIVDSGSKDETLRIASSYREVKVISYPREVEFNYSKALNLGIAAGSQPLVAIISSHVILSDPSIVSKLASRMADPACAGAYMCPGNSSEDVVTIQSFTGRNGMSNSCGMIRRVDWEARMFSEDLAACEDQDYAAYWLRRGFYFLRFRDPNILYLNPYSHPWKRIRDEVVICQYIHPPLRNKQNYLKKFRNVFGSLKRGHVRDAYWHTVGIVMLSLSGLFRMKLKSSYRRELAG
jgi:glycosyltransferase involved in cell wall biosynthesis